jgi:DNA-binding response OmpR family regulator
MTRILLVDDDDGLRRVLAQALTQQGYAVVEASNGREALELYDRHGADVVVIDVVMPEKEGLETIVELKQRPRIPGIVVMSGGGQISPKVYLKIAKAYRADEILEKPFSGEELLAAVAKVELRLPGAGSSRAAH